MEVSRRPIPARNRLGSRRRAGRDHGGGLGTSRVPSGGQEARIDAIDRVLSENYVSLKELLASMTRSCAASSSPWRTTTARRSTAKVMARQILDKHSWRIPDTHQGPTTLQGVGRKVAYLMLNFILAQDAVAVDTHILRLLG